MEPTVYTQLEQLSLGESIMASTWFVCVFWLLITIINRICDFVLFYRKRRDDLRSNLNVKNRI